MKEKLAILQRQNALTSYFHDMSSSGDGLLSAEGEAALAHSLRESDERVWQICLTHPLLVKAFSEYASSRLDEKKAVSFRGVRSASTRLRNAANKKNKATLHASAQKTAVLLRDRDPDQQILTSYIAELEAIVAGKKCKIDGHTYAGTNSKLAEHCAEIRKARAVATAVRNRFVSSNLGLVVSVARRYQFSGMNLADLIQEGNLGLLKAVSRYDERKGFRFSTYATWWIRHAVGRSVADKSRTVRIPVHVTEAHQKIKKVTTELASQLNRQPSREEIAKTMDMSVKKLESTIRSAQGHSLSLDAPIGEDGDRARMEVFSQETGDSAFDQMAELALSQRATKALDTLAPIEIEILHRRFGLAGKTATTLQEIANTIGKSRERIRQIQEKALLKLREHLVAEHAV